MLDVKQISCGEKSYPFLFGVLAFAEVSEEKEDNPVMASLKTLYIGIKNGAEAENVEPISFDEFKKLCNREPQFMSNCKDAMAEHMKVVGESLGMREKVT